MVRTTEFARAKINLTLDILGKRVDGYHEVEMIMQAVDLADQLIFTERSSDSLSMECDVSYVPTDDRNLIIQTAKLLQTRYDVKHGVHVELTKKIPVSAGLAGGSSNAAATLRGLNRLWDLQLSQNELLQLATEIGSDVAFCVFGGGTALAKGRGEIIEVLPKAPPMNIILAKLPISVATSVVYKKYRHNLHAQPPGSKLMIEAIKNNDVKAICDNLCNSLEKITFAMHPQVKQLKEKLIKFGANGVLMSGSGPTVYAIIEREQKALRIQNALNGFCKEVFLARTC